MFSPVALVRYRDPDRGVQFFWLLAAHEHTLAWVLGGEHALDAVDDFVDVRSLVHVLVHEASHERLQFLRVVPAHQDIGWVGATNATCVRACCARVVCVLCVASVTERTRTRPEGNRCGQTWRTA